MTRLASASFSAFGAFISAMNTVIDPTVKVAFSSRIVSIVAVGSSRYISTSGAPINSEIAMWAISPVMWNNGATPSTTSSPVSPTQSR